MKRVTPFFKIITIFLIIAVKSNNVLANFTNPLPTVLPSLHSNAFNCPPGTFHTAHPYNEDCTKYIVCSNGQANIENCASGTAFDKNRGLCDDINKVKCDTNSNASIRCRPDQNYQKSVFPYSPTKYTICSSGKVLIENCGDDELYSISRHSCLPKQIVSPNDRVPEVLNRVDVKIYCPSDLFGIFPYPFNKQIYIKCVYGDLIMKQCRPFTAYNHLTKFCEEYVKNTETHTVHQTDSNEDRTFLSCPKNLSGNFLYPFDCTKYVICTPQGTEIKSCPYNHIYSIQYRKCLSNWLIYADDHIECQRPSENNDQINNNNGDYLGVYCSVNSVGVAYPYPGNWHKYVVCENNIPRVMMCPYNQVFNIETRNCETNSEEK